MVSILARSYERALLECSASRRMPFAVSILARSYERALLLGFKDDQGEPMFQSSPAHMSGRYQIAIEFVAVDLVFQSSPAHMSGRYKVMR